MTMHQFNQNILFLEDDKTYQALRFHFNKIAATGNNKRFEWEDEELTETYGITFDFDEWFSHTKECVSKEYLMDKFEIPENLGEGLLGYTNQLKDFVDGFVFSSTGMYQGKAFLTECYRSFTFDGILERMNEVRDNNQMVFLQEVYYVPERLEDVVVKNDNHTTTYPKNRAYYKVRYGVING